MLTFNRLSYVCPQIFFVLISFAALPSFVAAAKQPLDPYVAAGVEDASLNGLCVASSDHVWVVGDRGAILATTNGGRNWTRQESATTVNLHAVVFKNGMEGCAVGGLPGALARTSRGVVLRTLNGGETWSAVPTEGLPRFTGMRIVGGRLIAWGDYCPQRKTGIFVSLDDGQSWQAMPSSIVQVAALGADASGNVLAVDRVGNAFNSQLGSLRSAFTTSPNQPIEFVERVGSTWLAGGADGQLLRSVDGQAWTRVTLPLSASAQRVCHWRAATQFEDQIWISGTPGTIVLHSADRGINWRVLGTEQTLPLRALLFADSQRGWAVGPLGLILATRDGGRSWYPQRRTASRVGLLSVTATDAQVPLAALVATSWDELIASTSLSLFGENLEQSAGYCVETWKVQEAIAPQLGLVEHRTWLQPKPTSTKPADLNQLTNCLAVELQSWRPDVVLTDETGGPKFSLANRAVMTALTTAIQRAALTQPQSVSEELRMPAWQVTKLATVTDPRSSQFSEHPNRLMRESGLSIWDVLVPTGANYDANAKSLSMRTIQQNQSTLANNASLFGGIAPAQASRRQVATRSLGNYQLIMGRVHRMTSLDSLATLPSEMPITEWQTKLDFVARTLPPRELAQSLLRIAHACSSPSLWPRKQIALERLIQLQPDGDTASHARLTLLQMHSSDELRAWKQSMGNETSGNSAIGNSAIGNSAVSSLASDLGSPMHRNASSLTPFDTLPASAASTGPQIPSSVGSLAVIGGPQSDNSQVTTASFSNLITPGAVGVKPIRMFDDKQGEAFFNALDSCYKSDPFLVQVPQLELMRDAVLRAKAEATRAIATPTLYLESLASLSALAGWPQAAQQEILLARGRPEQLRWIAFAVATPTRPRLDGVLEEPMWAACPPMQLLSNQRMTATTGNTQASPSTIVRWSYDDDYLYIAIDSPLDPNSIVNRGQRLRKYDSDLEGAAHVHFTLDTDRDYASAIELAVSAEGETFDRCCGMNNYNPQYAVAVSETPLPDRWTAELAIRLSDLTTRPQLTGRAWAVSAYSHSVDGEHQSWSSMLSDQPALQAAGLLLFVTPPNEAAK